MAKRFIQLKPQRIGLTRATYQKNPNERGNRMGLLKKIKPVRDPKKYAKSGKVGAKAVKTQMKKRQMLKEAGNIRKPKKKK